MGTQVWREKNGTETHKAIFSMWDASKDIQTTGVGPACARFGGEGVGSHCLITYPLEQARLYTIKVELESTNSSGAIWLGTITDKASSAKTEIGRLYCRACTLYTPAHPSLCPAPPSLPRPESDSRIPDLCKHSLVNDGAHRS
jgi:hypothetical protein